MNQPLPSTDPDNVLPAGKDDKGGNPRTPSRMRSWLVKGAALLGVVATLTLGTWQLQRAVYKKALAEQIFQQNTLEVLDNNAQEAIENIANVNTKSNITSTTVASTYTSWVHRNVRWQGTWLDEHTVFLDNRFMAGRAGFYVATPLQLQGNQALVWVQRGWVARDGQDRARLPVLTASVDAVTVQGKVIQGISRIYELGGQSGAASAAGDLGQPSALAVARASQIRQNLPQLPANLQQRLLPVAVLQTLPTVQSVAGQVDATAQPPDGLLRDWPQADAGVAKHYGYAFQWFALCCLIIVLYVWLQILAPRRQPSH